MVNGTGGGILHGGRIEQREIAAIELPSTGLGAVEVRARLKAAWAAARDPQQRSAAASAAILAKNHETIAAWLLECGETAPADQIVERMTAARERLNELTARLSGTAA